MEGNPSMNCENCNSSQVEILDESKKSYRCNHCRRKVENGICTFEGDEIQKDFTIYFQYEISSKDWDGETGTPFDEKRTKSMLLADLRENLQDIVAQDDGNLLNFCSYKSTTQARIDELKEQAKENYQRIHGLENFLEALRPEERTELDNLQSIEEGNN